jgi:hypothetical protein
LEIVDKLINVFLIAQVIASWKEILDLEFIIQEAVVPQVFAEASLRCQLSVVREMIVPLFILHLAYGSLFVSYIVLYVKDWRLRTTWY